jgi:hypothetical protein
MTDLPKQFADMVAYAHQKRNSVFVRWTKENPVIHKNEEAQIWDRAFMSVCMAGNKSWQKTVPFKDPDDYPLQVIRNLCSYLQNAESKEEVARCTRPLAELKEPVPMRAYIDAITAKKLPLSDETIHVDAIFVHCELVVGSAIARWRLSGTPEDKSRGIILDDAVRAQMDDQLKARLIRFDAPDGNACNFCEIAIVPRRNDRDYLTNLIKLTRRLAKTDVPPPPRLVVVDAKENPSDEDAALFQRLAEITVELAKKYKRPAIDEICKIHGIKCLKSATKSDLITSIVSKLGEEARNEAVLYKREVPSA